MGMYGWHDNDLKAEEIQANTLIVSSGTNVIVDADAWTHGGQGLNLRYKVTDWAATYGQTLNQFQGFYLRAENTEAGSGKTLRGAEINARDNNVGIGVLHGLHVNAYIKGTAAGKTIGQVDGVQAQIEFANNVGTRTVSNDSACLHGILYARTTVTGLTNLHGLMLDFGDQAGGSPTMGCGIYMLDNTGVSGTATLTYGIRMTIATATAISIAGNTSKVLDATSTMSGESAVSSTTINLTDATTQSSGYTRGIYVNATVSGDKTGSGEHNSIAIDQSVSGDTPYLYGFVFYSADVGDPTIGFAAPISIYQDDLGTALGAYVGIDIGLAFSHAPADRYSFMRFRDHSTAVPTSVFRFEGAHCASYLFDTTGGTGTPDFITTNAGQTPAADGILIAVNYHGTPYYLKAASAWS